MYEFISSPDGRYYASLKDNVLNCCYEGSPFYTKRLNYDNVKLLALANNANLVILANNSIIVVPPDNKAEHKIMKGLTKQDLIDEQSVITALYINEIGTQICVGKMQMLTGIKSKIKTFFSISDSKSKDTECHTLSFRSLLAERHTDYFDDNFDAQIANKFSWHISKDFSWLALAKPVKTIAGVVTEIKLINIMERAIYAEHKVNSGIVKSLLVNKEGTILADVLLKDKKIAQILCQNKYRSQFEYNSDWSILHLGNDYVVFETDNDRLVARSFEDKVLCDASIKPLKEMNIPYHIHFMDKKNLNIIEAMNDELKIVRTSIDLINTDSKRWTFIQKSMYEQKIAEEQKNTEKTARDMIYQKKKAELAQTVTRSKKRKVENEIPEFIAPEIMQNSIPQRDMADEYLKKVSSDNIIPKEIADQMAYNEELSMPVKNIDMLDLYNSNEPSPETVQKLDDLDTLEVKPIIQRVRSLSINVPERRRIRPLQALDAEDVREEAMHDNSSRDETRHSEKIKIMKLVDMLDERFIQGEVTEAVYKELKSKYLRKIKTLGQS